MIRLLERRFEIAVPLADAWRSLARVGDWPRWAAHIRRIDLMPLGLMPLGVTPPEELGADSVGTTHLRNGLRSTFRLREFRPGHSWKWVGPFLWLAVHHDHRFEALAPRRTRLVWTIDGEGAGVAVLGRLFAAVYARDLDKAIPKFVACASETAER